MCGAEQSQCGAWDARRERDRDVATSDETYRAALEGWVSEAALYWHKIARRNRNGAKVANELFLCRNDVQNCGMIYGYARVSTDGQSVDAQVKQLRGAGCEKIFRETASGTRADRVQLRRVLSQLDKGDVLMVTRLDRLARSTRDLLNTLATIADNGAGFRSLGDAWADTTTAHGRLMLTVLGGLAEFERELIRARTGEGRDRARAQGVKMGRKPKLTPHQRREAIRRRDHGDPSSRQRGRRHRRDWCCSKPNVASLMVPVFPNGTAYPEREPAPLADLSECRK